MSNSTDGEFENCLSAALSSKDSNPFEFMNRQNIDYC